MGKFRSKTQYEAVRLTDSLQSIKDIEALADGYEVSFELKGKIHVTLKNEEGESMKLITGDWLIALENSVSVLSDIDFKDSYERIRASKNKKNIKEVK